MLPSKVTALLNSLIPAIRDALPDNFVGAYLFGSLATADFDPTSSDIDVLVITQRLASEAEFAALAEVHERIPPGRNVSGREYEVYYVDRETIRRPVAGARQMRSDPDETLRWEAQRMNFVIERWVLREHGVTLTGPEPRTLIDPVSVDDLRGAARSELNIRIDDWAGGQPTPDWLGHRGAQGYEVETVCRALYTIETGQLCSKQRAVEWAKEALPAEWRPIIEWAERHRKDRTQDTSRLEECVVFVRYAVERASMAADER